MKVEIRLDANNVESLSRLENSGIIPDQQKDTLIKRVFEGWLDSPDDEQYAPTTSTKYIEVADVAKFIMGEVAIAGNKRLGFDEDQEFFTKIQNYLMEVFRRFEDFVDPDKKIKEWEDLKKHLFDLSIEQKEIFTNLIDYAISQKKKEGENV